MDKLLRYWNQNKRKILITIAVIALILIVIRIANTLVKMQKEQAGNTNAQKNSITAQDVTKPNESVITDDKLTEKETEKNSELIQKFVENCNEQNAIVAYEMLSDSCKQQVYTTIDRFTQNYINQIFAKAKTYELDLWSTANGYDTYRIIYKEGNPLQTGGNSDGKNYVDYITIVKQNGELKLNISNFITQQNINKTGEDKGVNIQINSKAIYTEYEIYNITVTNNTEKTIILSDRKNANNVCLLDERDNQYPSFIYEIAESSLTIEAKNRKTFQLKFHKQYVTNAKIRYMEVKDIYLDKNQYDNSSNQNEIQKASIKIKF